MKNFFANLSKTSITAIVALLFVLAFITIDILCLLVKTPDKDVTIMVLSNITGIAGFVAGFYFNKKLNDVKGE